MRKIIFLTAFLFLMISAIPSLAQTSTYEFEGITSFFDSSDEGVTFSTTDTCQVRMRGTNTFTSSSSFDSTASFRSPDSTTIATSELTGISNTSCLSYGASSIKDVSRDGTSGMYESSWSVSQSADSGFATLGTRWICTVNSDVTDVRVTRALDSRGFCQYRRRAADTDLLATWRTQLQGNYNICGEIDDWVGVSCNATHTTGAPGTDATISYIYPFNSSVEGIVNYSFSTSTYSAGSTVFPDIFIDLINTEDGTIQNLHTQDAGLVSSFTFSAFSDELSLSPNTMFLWVVTYVILDNAIVFTSTINPPELNMSIFTFAGDFVCGDFGACVNGSQSRVCVDQQGISPDRIETRSCFDVPAHEIDLGFEAVRDFIPEFIYTCQKDWTLISCTDFLATIPARFPVNWTISADLDRPGGGYRQNYIRISDDTSTVGTSSLQMNYIPPKLSEPISDPGNASQTVCGNKTSGDFPFVTTGLNQSLFVSVNISFPSPFIQLRLDARKCLEPILQYDYTSGIYSLCDITGIQRKLCYSTNCSAEPGGNYRIGVFDAQSLEEIVEFSDVAINSWTSNIIDMSNAGLIVNRNYTIIIVVNPEVELGVFDPNSHCVYFDNFRVTITETSLPECTTRCEGFNLLLATQNGDVCFFSEITNSPGCAPDIDTAESFQNFEEVCIETTLHFFNNVTGLWDQIEDSELCESQAAITEEDINITTPLEDTGSYIEFFDFLFSPIFIYIIFSLIISGILSAGIAKVTKNGDGVFQVFGVAMMIFVLLGSLPGIAVIPIWISIAIIAVISLLIANKLGVLSIPGGGG